MTRENIELMLTRGAEAKSPHLRFNLPCFVGPVELGVGAANSGTVSDDTNRVTVDRVDVSIAVVEAVVASEGKEHRDKTIMATKWEPTGFRWIFETLLSPNVEDVARSQNGSGENDGLHHVCAIEACLVVRCTIQ
jgi:hypothetical protein